MNQVVKLEHKEEKEILVGSGQWPALSSIPTVVHKLSLGSPQAGQKGMFSLSFAAFQLVFRGTLLLNLDMVRGHL